MDENYPGAYSPNFAEQEKQRQAKVAHYAMESEKSRLEINQCATDPTSRSGSGGRVSPRYVIELKIEAHERQIRGLRALLGALPSEIPYEAGAQLIDLLSHRMDR